MKTPRLRIGTKCRFSHKSGNPPTGVTICGRERHNGIVFYRVAEHIGGLFLLSSLDPVETKSFGKAGKRND